MRYYASTARMMQHTISNKTFDFSAGTIKLLLERGYDDAKDEINQYVRNQLVT